MDVPLVVGLADRARPEGKVTAMASEEIFPDEFDDADDEVLDDAETFGQFLGIVLNMATEQPDREADEKSLREMLPRLRAEGKAAHAASLVADYVQKHGKPLRWDD